ncbi:MAG: hypothetical protein EZS28_006662 [Streblomastix strix]|uniref:Uncharacterized protein n=1 Tax=Streblomastix strix TaxID=222440 RepID=A0A5J4WTW6_9EUKA|nr:MAG: hypothetical protein EZS28_006662 [Streblomastix strix]
MQTRRFSFSPRLTLLNNISLNSFANVLLADIEDYVTKIQMKTLDVTKLLSLLKKSLQLDSEAQNMRESKPKGIDNDNETTELPNHNF